MAAVVGDTVRLAAPGRRTEVTFGTVRDLVVAPLINRDDPDADGERADVRAVISDEDEFVAQSKSANPCHHDQGANGARDIAPAVNGRRAMSTNAHATVARRAARARARLLAWSSAARLPRRTVALDGISRPPERRACGRRVVRESLRIISPCRDHDVTKRQ
jgi:hypothetical protein